jgi:hypothetical protein
MANQPYSYGIPDGTYVGKPTTASCYEKDGRLILDIRFAVKDPKTGTWYMKDNGYEWDPTKRHWLTSKDGGFNEATINGLKEWAKGWNPQAFDDFYWFQREVDGVPFGNLAAIGKVELNFQTDSNGNQQIWVHDPNRPKSGGRKAYVPDGGNGDAAALAAKWGAKAKALFAATPKKVGAGAPQAAQKPAQAATPAARATAPSRPSAPAQAAPTLPAAAPAQPKPWSEFPQTADGAFAYFCSLLEGRGEKYSSEKHDEEWFDIFDKAAQGKDPDEFGPEDVQRLFQAVGEGALPF